MMNTTRLGDLILSILARQAPEWMTRKDIAQQLRQRDDLTPYDIKLLDELESLGLIEIRTEDAGPIRKTYFYKAKGG